MAPPTRRDVLRAGMGLSLLPRLARADAPRALSLGIARDIQGRLDPAFRLGAIEGNIIRAICPGLIESDPSGSGWQLALARRVTAISDTAIGFELREGLAFNAGFGPVTAADVAFSYERFRRKGTDGELPPYADDWAALDGVEITGPLSGVIHLRAPSPMLWRSVLPDVSGCIISRRALEAGAYRLDRNPPLVVGAGNWDFSGWRPNERVMLRRLGGGAISHIDLLPVREARTAELALRGDALQFAAVPPADLVTLRQPGLAQIARPAQNLVWIGINVQHPPFDDARVRQAIAASLDLDQLVAGAWDGAVPRAYAAIAPGMPGSWDDAPRPRRNVAAAHDLLAQAGHAKGLRARLLLLDRPDYQAVGVIAQAMLREAGISLDLDIRDEGAFWSAGGGDAGREVQLALQRFGGKPDPSFLLQWFTSARIGSWNWQRWGDAPFDALVAQAATTPNGPARDVFYGQAQSRMQQSGAFIFLTHELVSCAYRDWLQPAVLENGEDWLLDRFSA